MTETWIIFNIVCIALSSLQTNRHIRLGELLREHSSNARMIVM